MGSILDSFGNLLMSAFLLDSSFAWVIESPELGIVYYRESVFEPLQTGILSIDSMVPNR